MPSLLTREGAPAVVHRAAFGAGITPTVARDSLNVCMFASDLSHICVPHTDRGLTHLPLPAVGWGSPCRAHSLWVTRKC